MATHLELTMARAQASGGGRGLEFTSWHQQAGNNQLLFVLSVMLSLRSSPMMGSRGREKEQGLRKAWPWGGPWKIFTVIKVVGSSFRGLLQGAGASCCWYMESQHERESGRSVEEGGDIIFLH